MKSELKSLLECLDPSKSRLQFPNFNLSALPEAIHDQALAVFEQIHAQVLDPNQQEEAYRQEITQSEALARLKFAFDCWCAVWFWEGDDLAFAPTPNRFYDPPAETRQIVEKLARKYQFFHWELEFPDVFRGKNSGFDGIIGNPPWENAQPNPAEYFSNIDPLFRTYGRLEAEAWMKQKFEESAEIEKDWIIYNAEFKAFANWVANIADPFGVGLVNPDERGFKGVNQYLTDLWKERINSQKGYTGTLHPFQLQKGRIFTYRLFLELSLFIANKKGRVGLIIPSGIYTDSWSNPIREYLLDYCQWDWLFVFENRDKIFSIDSRFKFCPIIVQKGLKTNVINTAFMRRSLTEWENAEKYVLNYSREQIEKFSPKSKSILEIQTGRDLEILTKIYENSVLLGDQSEEGWGIKYRLEFMMNTDAKLFPPRPKWEAQGYIADEYGHWLKGNWQDLSLVSPPSKGDLGGLTSQAQGKDLSPLALLERGEMEGWQEILNRPEGVILSRDKTQFIQIDDVEDIALPLYEGRMIGQFDFSQKGWVSGKGRTAEWRDISFEEKIFEPQFLMGQKNFTALNSSSTLKTGFMDVGSSTNSRTMFSSFLQNYPCGNKVPTFNLAENNKILKLNLELSSILNSFIYDYQMRNRLGGLTLNYFILEETSLTPKNIFSDNLLVMVARLSLISINSSISWLKLKDVNAKILSFGWCQLWAITPYERLRLRCILDAVVAELYGLDIEDFAWILKECDYPTAQVTDKTFARTLDPKGFWRVDKEKDPELRHTVLSLVAFQELKKIGLDPFLNLNDGEGWMLPDTLRLADYGLGHDDRATEPQPITARFTLPDWDDQPVPDNAPLNYRQRFYPWQLAKTPEQSWAECERHAENLRLLLKQDQPPESTPTKSAKLPSDPDYQPPTDLFGNPLQVDLFGNVIDR